MASYKHHAARVEAARRAANAAAARRRMRPDGRWDGGDPSFADWEARVDEFWEALREAYPPKFWDAYQRLKAGDPTAVDAAVEFLEADPMCHRSGYVKADLLRFLGRVPLQPAQADRLRAVVLMVAATRDGREFRRYCALARHLDTPAFQTQLRQLAATDNRAVRRRAGWVLAALEPPPAKRR